MVFSAAFGALLYRFAARLFSPRAGFLALLAVSILPAFFFTSFLANPEAPLAPLWVLFLLLLDDLRRRYEPGVRSSSARSLASPSSRSTPRCSRSLRRFSSSRRRRTREAGFAALRSTRAGSSRWPWLRR